VVFLVPANVKLVKFPGLDEVDSGFFDSALEHFFKKIGSFPELQLSFKEYARGGLKVQHEVHGKVLLNGSLFVASSTGWQLLGTIQDVLKKLEKEILKSLSKD
jgi:hypothetical protein